MRKKLVIIAYIVIIALILIGATGPTCSLPCWLVPC